LFEEGIAQARFSVVDEVVAPTYVNHTFPAPAPGAEGLKQVVNMFLTAFPDFSLTIHDIIGEGNRVATRGTWSGTHQGTFMNIPATGKQVSVNYMDIFRVENGKIVENWVQMDMLGLMQQLGLVPTPEQAAA
jgi:steroid delta-isomerase-like uncharacterized protein